MVEGSKLTTDIAHYDVIVTGASGLIGVELCRHLIDRGLKVASLDLKAGEDLGSSKFLEDFFAKNKADALINLFAMNEHISQKTSLASSLRDFQISELDNYFHVNVSILFGVCRAYAVNNEKGSIVNFSSIYGVRQPKKTLYDGGLKHIGYSLSKAAVIALSEYLAIELAPNIRVNTIVPGGIQNNQSEEFIARYSNNCLMGRMGRVSDLFGIIDYLISSQSEYTTGSLFRVDGGWLL